MISFSDGQKQYFEFETLQKLQNLIALFLQIFSPQCLSILSMSLVLDQDLENKGGKLILAPTLESPEAFSDGVSSALIEGPNSMPKPTVEAFILPSIYSLKLSNTFW